MPPSLTRRSALGLIAAGALAGPTLAQKKTGGRSAATAIAGRYRAEGRNPDGSAYSGTVAVVQQGEAVEFTWQVGNDTYRGTGTVEGRIVTVDWGDAHPVVYVVMADGELHGTWADGAALERLRPM